MINHWMITGDTHAGFSRFKSYDEKFQQGEDCAVIILGDSGLNYTLDEGDSHLKNMLHKRYKFTIYCVRGNHEARPQDVPGMEVIYDEDVDGDVYYQPQWPRIRYFKDWGIYNIGGHSVAVIGGAYSVDKFYRLKNHLRWFANEQLSTKEMRACMEELKGKQVDFVFTHTCPFPWQPTDLFLSSVNQSEVDKSMEVFLEELAKAIDWKIFLFGHFHDDRLVRPYVEMYFKDTENLEDIWNRWEKYRNTGYLDWWLTKDPSFYQKDEILKGKL